MSIFTKIKNLIIPTYQPSEEKRKTIKDLDFLDTVWMLDSDNVLLEGWVFDINKRHVTIAIPIGNSKYLDFRFEITKPLNRDRLIQSNKILFLNKPCASEISSSFQKKEDL